MIDLRYSLIIEATKDPNFFSFHSPDLEGFTGVGHSIEDCIHKAKQGMEEHIVLLKERGLPVPKRNLDPRIIIQDEKRMTAIPQNSSRSNLNHLSPTLSSPHSISSPSRLTVTLPSSHSIQVGGGGFSMTSFILRTISTTV